MDQEDYEKEKEKNKEMKHELLVLKVTNSYSNFRANTKNRARF